MKSSIWFILFIMLCVFVLIDSIHIELDIDDTIWIERKTDRPIYVYQYNPDVGVRYRYAGEDFDKYMPLKQLLIKFKHDT